MTDHLVGHPVLGMLPTIIADNGELGAVYVCGVGLQAVGVYVVVGVAGVDESIEEAVELKVLLFT